MIHLTKPSPHGESGLDPKAEREQPGMAGYGLFERATRVAARHVVILTSYIGAFTVLLVSLTRLNEPSRSLFGGHAWVLMMVAVLPLALSIAFITIPAAMGLRRQNWLKDKGLHGVPSRPGYFRITPYEDNAEDRQSYARADGAHLEVEGWLSGTDQSVLYLTGLSGAGKSSLLNAYVLPGLRLGPDRVRPIVVPRHDSFQALRRELLSPGVVWKKPPVDDHGDLRDLVQKACEYLRQARLILVFDQFEELLILHERDQGRIDELHGLFELVRNGKTKNLTFLFVFRSDYKGLIHGLSRLLELPTLRQDDNWKEIGPFTERQARDFLVHSDSGLTIGEGLMDEVFGQIAEVEEAEGLVRPITLNMMGLILRRSALASVRALPRRREAEGLLFGYLRQSIGHSRVKDHARPILQAMITPAGTKCPRRVSELAAMTGFSEGMVVGCLLELVEPGLVRRIDERENVWEISHDFVARLLLQVLSTWRTSLLRRARLWTVPMALGAWVVVFLVVPAATPWYKRIPLADISRLDPTGQSSLHRAALDGDKDEAAAAVTYLLANGADVNIRDRDGFTSLHVASSNGHHRVMESLIAGKADVEIKDKQGETALHKATNNGDVEALKILLGNKAEIEQKNNDGYTGLCIASIRGSEDALRFLLDRGASVKARDLKDHTPLHLAAINGQAKVADLLIARGSDPEVKDVSGHTALHETAIEGKAEVAKVLLDRGDKGKANTEALDNTGVPPLIWAANKGHKDVARVLLDRGANPEGKDPNGNTALYFASYNGHLPTVQALFEAAHRPSIASRNLTGASPMHAAASGGHGPIVTFLLANGAEIEIKDNYGNTPLIAAAMANRAEVSRLLLVAGADPEAKEFSANTCLHWASNNGHAATVKALLETAPSPAIASRNSAGLTALHVAANNGHAAVAAVLLDRGAELELKDNNGYTPLLWAAAYNRAEVARLLLDRRADPEAKDSNGNTPLNLASYNGHVATVQIMLDKPPSPQIASPNFFGISPLHAAAAAGHVAVVTTLVDRRADIEARDNSGNTPILLAAGQNRLDVARLLLDRGAEVNAKDNTGSGILQIPAQSGFKDMVELLLGRKAEIDAANSVGATPLHQAAFMGHPRVVELLLRRGAQVEAISSNRARPLHAASMGGNVEVVKLLLDRNAEINPSDASGDTPLHVAIRQGRFEAAKLLLDRHADSSIKNSSGSTPVDVARMIGDKRLLELFVNR